MAITVKTFYDYDGSAVSYEHDPLDHFPVGYIFISIKNTNPGTFLGGTWVPWGSGRVPVGVNTSDSSFNTVEKTGGAKTHTLTVNEIPSHQHNTKVAWDGSVGGTNPIQKWAFLIHNPENQYGLDSDYTGGGQAHNNLQPYITCYMWKRTA